MRTAALFACFSTIYLSALAQNAWLVVINGPALVGVQSVSVGPDDNAFAVGDFENGVNLGGTTYEGSGSFLIKLSKDGTMLWHKVVRYGPGEVRSLRKVQTDAGGNAYIAGIFPQAVTVDGVSLSFGYSYNGFVAKFNPQGQIQWAKVVGNVKEFIDMKVNANGQILLYSMQAGNVAVNTSSFATGLNSTGVMLTSQGALLWAKPLGNLNGYTTWPRACAIDDNGNAYLHGIFSGTLTVDGHQVASSGGNHNFFVAKIDAQGTCEWITSVDRKVPAINETDSPPNGLMVERGALDADEDGNIYLGGYSWTGIKVGSLSLSEEGTCIIKFDGTGRAVWIKLGETASRSTIGNLVVNEGKIYVSGTRPGAFYFSVYNTDGTYDQSGGVTNFPASFPGGLSVDSEHQVYLSGRIAYGASRLQGFVLKYGTPTHVPGAASAVTGPISICPSDNFISITTSPIDYAAIYQWEINPGSSPGGGTRFILETYLPELHFRPSEYKIDHDFSIRVRGKTVVGIGDYSTETTIKLEQPRAPTLVLRCGEISIENPEGITAVDWYFNNIPAVEYGRTSTSITPAREGFYNVIVHDICGPVTSNVLVFAEEHAPTLLVSCGKISVKNPEAVTAVDWYFNGTLAEEYDRSNTSITPKEEGTYQALVDKGCGPMLSIEVTFVPQEPKEPPALIASCTEISIVEPEAGMTVNWYLNNERIELYDSLTTSIRPNQTGTYYVDVDDACGPLISNPVSFELLNAGDLELPNVITPDGDAFNQQFAVDNRLDSPALVVFNRWGKEVYASDKYTNTWEGDNLPSGVYFYELRSSCLSTAIKGTLSIVR
jgi:gliding motility-associated-like protein